MRRLITIPAVAVALPIWVLATPIWLTAAIVADSLGRLWKFPTVRLCAFGALYLLHEWAGIVAAAWLWLSGGFGRRLDLRAHRSVQAWWASSLLRWANRLLHVRLEILDSPPLPTDSFIVLSRHASMVDALLPLVLVADRNHRYVHYVLKRELRWDPNLDLFGGRLRNYFVARGSRSAQDTKRQLDGIRRMAKSAKPGAGLVIFPEGTYATPRSRQRVLTSLRKRGDHTATAQAELLHSLLPPRLPGTAALLEAQPDANVIIIGHIGLEGVAELRGLRQRLPLTDPVRIQWWVHRRDELPATEDLDAQADWLINRWQELDRWVTDQQDKR